MLGPEGTPNRKYKITTNKELHLTFSKISMISYILEVLNMIVTNFCLLKICIERVNCNQAQLHNSQG